MKEVMVLTIPNESRVKTTIYKTNGHEYWDMKLLGMNDGSKFMNSASLILRLYDQGSMESLRVCNSSAGVL